MSKINNILEVRSEIDLEMHFNAIEMNIVVKLC